MMLFQSMKITQRRKRFGNISCGVGTSSVGGKGREGRGNFRHAFSFLWNLLESPVYGAGCWKAGSKNVQSKGDLCAMSVCQTPLLDAMSGAEQLPHGNICPGAASGDRENGFSSFFSCLKPPFPMLPVHPPFPKHPVHGVKVPSLKRVVCFGFWGPTQVHKWGGQRGETFVLGRHHGKGKRENKYTFEK